MCKNIDKCAKDKTDLFCVNILFWVLRYFVFFFFYINSPTSFVIHTWMLGDIAKEKKRSSKEKRMHGIQKTFEARWQRKRRDLSFTASLLKFVIPSSGSSKIAEPVIPQKSNEIFAARGKHAGNIVWLTYSTIVLHEMASVGSLSFYFF